MKDFIKKWKMQLNMTTYVVLIGCLVYFVVIPMYQKIQTQQNEIQEEITNQEMKNKNLQELPKIKQQFEFISSKDGDVDVLLKKEDAVVLIKKLENLAEETGNKISIEIPETVAPKTKTTNSKNKEETALIDSLPEKDYLEMNIKLTGSYAKITSFISKLEAAQYYCDVISLQISESTSALNSSSGSQNGGQMFSSGDQGQVVKNMPQEGAQGELEANIDVVFYLAK